ncbi:MAG TPA: alpha/beta hydrolase [Pseudonocardiaceae bacterium]
MLLVHGWAQSAACWSGQLDDAALTGRLRLAAVDLRGHGSSDAPADGYDDPARWADDLWAVRLALGGGPVVLAGWSYGGLVIADHLARCGTADVDGVLLVGAITGLGRGVAAGRIGPVMRAALPAALSSDPAVARPALDTFVRGMTPAPLSPSTTSALVDASMAVPPHVRAALFDRVADGGGLVGALGTGGPPVLVQHGTADPVVQVATAEHHLRVLPEAEADLWEGAGHAPFLEDPARFGETLLAFVRRCRATRERMAT